MDCSHSGRSQSTAGSLPPRQRSRSRLLRSVRRSATWKPGSASGFSTGTTRSVSLTEAGQAYLSRIGPALSDVLEAGEQLHELQGRPSGVLRINAARISTAMVLQPLLAGFLKAYPDVQVELTNDEGYVDIVERGFDAGVRMGESVQKDMVAVPLGGPVAVSIVGSPDYFKQHPVPRHPSDLMHHNCVRFRFSGSGAIHKWELEVEGRIVEYEISGNLTISDSLFSIEAALDGIALAYTFEQLALPHIRAKKLKRVLSSFSPTFPGFYLYYPSRRQQPAKLKALREATCWRIPAPRRLECQRPCPRQTCSNTSIFRRQICIWPIAVAADMSKQFP